jgi:hypothetical protein
MQVIVDEDMLSDANDYDSEPSYENTAPMMRSNNPIVAAVEEEDDDNLSYQSQEQLEPEACPEVQIQVPLITGHKPTSPDLPDEAKQELEQAFPE